VNTGTSFVSLNIDWGRVDAQLGALDGANTLECAAVLAPHLGTMTRVLLAALGEPGSNAAVLAGPWCFADSKAVEPCRAELGLAIGETLSDAWGLSGARFERRRDAWASSRSALLACHSERVERVRVEGDCITAWTSARQRTAGCVVLATGGLLGGGLVLNDRRELVSVPALEPAIALQRRGELWLEPASQTGVDVQAMGASELSAIGLPAVFGNGRVSVAGELRADLPRGVLAAVSSGMEAAERALAALKP
jgi:hypothetical protein